MKPRQGSDPKRRIAPPGRLDQEQRKSLVAKLTYVGSALHKTKPGDYGFQPPVNPRPWKSICDGRGMFFLLRHETYSAEEFFRGWSVTSPEGGAPKYVWAVDGEGEAYEAKSALAPMTTKAIVSKRMTR